MSLGFRNRPLGLGGYGALRPTIALSPPPYPPPLSIWWRRKCPGKRRAWERVREWGRRWPSAETARHPLGSASKQTLQSRVPQCRARAGLPRLLYSLQGLSSPAPRELVKERFLGRAASPQRADGQLLEQHRQQGGRAGAAKGCVATVRRARLFAFPPEGTGASDHGVPGPVHRRGKRQRGDRVADWVLPGHADHHQLVPGQHGSVRPAYPTRAALRPLPPLALATLGFRPLLCRLLLCLGEGCTYATLLHRTALCVERYLAYCRPLCARVVITQPRVSVLIAALWALALLSAGPFFFLVGIEQDPGVSAFPDLNSTV